MKFKSFSELSTQGVEILKSAFSPAIFKELKTLKNESVPLDIALSHAIWPELGYYGTKSANHSMIQELLKEVFNQAVSQAVYSNVAPYWSYDERVEDPAILSTQKVESILKITHRLAASELKTLFPMLNSLGFVVKTPLMEIFDSELLLIIPNEDTSYKLFRLGKYLGTNYSGLILSYEIV